MSQENIENNNEKTEIIKELDQNLMDHEYDGILELDNSLPPWWLILFGITVFFAFIYLGYYFVMGGPSQAEEYVAEMQQAQFEVDAFNEMMGGTVDENTVTLLTDETGLNAGKEIYDANCVACHGANGEGGVGPNLGDEYWIHGNSINDVYRTVKNGVPEKGMIPWESQLKPEQMQQVSSYILQKIAGTNPAGGKEPEGEKR